MRSALWILVFASFLFAGCNQKRIAVYYPYAHKVDRMTLEMAEVRKVFHAAAEQLLVDIRNKPALANLTFQYLIPENGFKKALEIEGPNVLKEIAAKGKFDGVVYAIIYQPLDTPFCESTLTFYLDKSAVQSRQSQGVLMDYNTFHSPAFWKSELYRMLVKIEGAL